MASKIGSLFLNFWWNFGERGKICNITRFTLLKINRKILKSTITYAIIKWDFVDRKLIGKENRTHENLIISQFSQWLLLLLLPHVAFFKILISLEPDMILILPSIFRWFSYFNYMYSCYSTFIVTKHKLYIGIIPGSILSEGNFIHVLYILFRTMEIQNSLILHRLSPQGPSLK